MVNEPQVITDEVIQAKANQLLIDTGQQDKIPVDVEYIAESLGFRIFFFEPDNKTDYISGAIKYVDKKIFLNNDDSIYRINFTLAHEIGHAVLHPHHDHIDYRGEEKGLKERQADEFAGNLLMPEKAFRAFWHYAKGNLSQLSLQFRVSQIAIAVRASILGLA